MEDALNISDNIFVIKSYIIENHLEVASLVGLVVYVFGYYYLLGKYCDYKDSLNYEMQSKHNIVFILIVGSVFTLVLIALKGFIVLLIYALLILFYKLIYTNDRYESYRNRFEDLF